MIEAGVLFLLGWLIGQRLGPKKPKDVPWPVEPTPKPKPGGARPKGEPWPTQDLAERANEEQRRKDALQARLDADAQAAVNKAKAAGDKEALADIARRKREKQAALDAMQADINAARAEAMSREMNRGKA